MASFQIPKRYYQAVREIISLDENQTSHLAEVLRKLPISLNFKSIASNTSEQLKSIGLSHGEDVFAFIVSLHNLSQEIGEAISLQEMVHGIADSINAEESLPKLENRGFFVNRLLAFLEASTALGIAAKAANVLTEHEHVFLESRILTDVRLIFDDVSEQPTEAVIVHNLRITFRQDSTRKDFFVALDNFDLAKLKKQIDRAEAKAKGIGTILEKTEINDLSKE